MSIVLENGVKASEFSAGELEQKIIGEQRWIRREVEALMKSVVETFCDINEYIESAQDEAEVTDDENRLPLPSCVKFHALYIRLESVFRRTVSLGKTVESWGLTIKGKAHFVNEWRKIRAIVSFDPSKVNEAFAQIARGQMKSLGEVASELRRKAV